nr:MAG TPA: hypothetical protein [Caudoviricetes sp.]
MSLNNQRIGKLPILFYNIVIVNVGFEGWA